MSIYLRPTSDGLCKESLNYPANLLALEEYLVLSEVILELRLANLPILSSFFFFLPCNGFIHDCLHLLSYPSASRATSVIRYEEQGMRNCNAGFLQGIKKLLLMTSGW